MSRFNYAKEKAEFDHKWAILEKEYQAAGMPKEDIQEMRDYDWNMFGRRRSWANHEISFEELLPSSEDFSKELDESNSSLTGELVVSDTYSILGQNPNLDWMNQITRSDLLEALLQFSEMNLCILTAYVFEGKSQKEIAAFYGISQQKVSARLCRMKKFFEKNFGGRV